MAHGNWFAVRTVFKFGQKSDGKSIYEERIVAFQAKDDAEALEKADVEGNEYADICGITEIHERMEAYAQDGEELIDGYELWSELYESHLSLDEFYADRYTKYNYEPDA